MRLFFALCAFAFLSHAALAEQTCQIVPERPFYVVDRQDYIYTVQGTDGWYFNAKQDLFPAFSISAENSRLLLQLTKELRQRGTELVIAYTPLRSMAVPSRVPPDNSIVKDRGYDPAKALASYKSLIESLNAQGIAVVGTPDMRSGEGYFRKYEAQHWADAGAEEMAEALTDFIRKQGWVGPLGNSKPQQQLFDDPNHTKVALAGTSFSYNNAFQDKLYEGLNGASLWNAAINGGGLDDALLSYLGSVVFRQDRPRVLIWEIPGYYSFDSAAMTTALRRAIGEVYGDCDAAHTLSANNVMLSLKPMLIPGIPRQENEAGQAEGYLSIRFSAPLAHPAALAYRDGSGTACIQLDKPYIPPSHIGFQYLLPEGVLETGLVFLPPPDFDGLPAEVKLCRLPQD